MLIWPWCNNLWSLALFSLCFGATAGGFAVLRPRFAAAVVGDDAAAAAAKKTSADTSESETTPPGRVGQQEGQAEAEARQRNKSMLIFGVFTAVRGTAILASGFITVALVHEDSEDVSGWGNGRRWRDLMIYTGVIMTASSLGALGKFVPHDRKFGGN